MNDPIIKYKVFSRPFIEIALAIACLTACAAFVEYVLRGQVRDSKEIGLVENDYENYKAEFGGKFWDGYRNGQGDAMTTMHVSYSKICKMIVRDSLIRYDSPGSTMRLDSLASHYNEKKIKLIQGQIENDTLLAYLASKYDVECINVKFHNLSFSRALDCKLVLSYCECDRLILDNVSLAHSATFSTENLTIRFRLTSNNTGTGAGIFVFKNLTVDTIDVDTAFANNCLLTFTEFPIVNQSDLSEKQRIYQAFKDNFMKNGYRNN